MNCKICSEKFDHSKREPYCLIPCTHSFCIECLKQPQLVECPICQTKFTSKNPNWSLLEIIPESSYDKLRAELRQTLREGIDLKKQVDKFREIKLEENLNRLNLLKENINNEATELVNSIQVQRDKLLNKTKNVEDYLNKKLNETRVNIQIESKLKETETLLNTNELDESEMIELKNEISARKSDLNNKIDQLNKLDNKYEFTPSKIKYEMGLIENSNWVKNPINSIQSINQGRAYHEQLKDYPKAIECYNKAIEMNPSDSMAYRNKGLVYYDLKEYDSALECYEKSLEFDSTNNNAYIGKSNVLKALKNYQGAVECFLKILEKEPNNVYVLYLLGNLHKEQKQFQEALNRYEKVIELNESYTNAHYSRGLILKEQKDYEASIGCFDRVIKIDPFYLNAYLSKGLALKELKNFSEAIAQFDKALEIDPQFLVANNSKISLLKTMNQKNQID